MSDPSLTFDHSKVDSNAWQDILEISTGTNFYAIKV